MSDSRVALGLDRLPWLPDEPVRAPRKPRADNAVWPWLVAAVILVAGASYWLGTISWKSPPPVVERPRAGPPQATVRLPEAVPAEPQQPQVRPAPMPEVEPIVAPPMPVFDEPATAPRRSAVTRARAKPAPSSSRAERAPRVEGKPAARPVVQKAQPLQVWPVRVVEGASGRLIRIGAFSTAHRAKKGWWAIVKMNPTLKRLPALVVPVQSLRNGRIYYRLQMGTTSQAHSEVLCQRMRMIAQSCVVIDERRSGG
jgi:hypothetical protein